MISSDIEDLALPAWRDLRWGRIFTLENKAFEIKCCQFFWFL